MKAAVALIVLCLSADSMALTGAFSYGAPAAGGSAACNDTIDNDSDGIVDYPGDAGCSAPSDTDESGDAKVVVTASSNNTDTSLESSISSAGGGSGPVTVCGGTGSTCDGTLRSVSGGLRSSRSDVSFNYIEATGYFRFGANGQRWVHGQTIATDTDVGCDASGGIFKNIGETESTCVGLNLSDIVVDSSLIDGGIRSASENKCWEGQIIVQNVTRLRVTNNTFRNFCPTILDPCPGGDCGHAEFLYLFYDNLDVLIAGNNFGDDSTYYDTNWSTGALFWTGNGGSPFTGYTTNSCVTRNRFGISGWNSVQTQKHADVPSAANINMEESSVEQGYDFTVGSGSTSTTVVANSGTKPAGANAYNGYSITMTSGSCNGQQKTLKNYNPSTGTWSLRTEYSEAWISCTPASGDTAHINVSNAGVGHAACDQCLDGVDNDGDGYIDLWDPQCTSGSDNTEGS